MEKIRIIGRSSALSRLQMEKVREMISAQFAGMEVELLTRESRGDDLADLPLHTVEGTDFFTGEIFTALKKGEADLAVHSLKDMSSEHFFGSHRFAVPDRDDPRDVLIWQPSFREKLETGKPVVVGTCSPRREEMAIGFLRSVIAPLGPGREINIEVKPIRGNVDTRLRKLANGEYDATILAAAGLNRILSSAATADLVRPFLASAGIVYLPLIECTPAPCQGAIVVESLPDNESATRILEAINNDRLWQACRQEKAQGRQFGRGCLQRFGVTSIAYDSSQAIYGAGKDEQGRTIDQWLGLPTLNVKGLRIFSSTDYMGRFFEYLYHNRLPVIEEPIVFVANYKAVHSQELADILKQKRVWAAGTKTWRELAGKGIWVEGSADALGLESLLPVWRSALGNIDPDDVLILTHETAAARWRDKGWKTAATYRLAADIKPALCDEITAADFIFWTSAEQYRIYGSFSNRQVIHACPSGETAQQLREAGLDPVVFPTIKAFQQWRNTIIP